MENPASWNDDTKAIAASMHAHHELERSGVIGGSVMARIDRDVVEPIRSKLNYVLKVLDLTDRYDCESELMWRVEDNDPGFAIRCSDAFCWGCADCEDLTPERLPDFIKALEDADSDGPLLYCARIRKMRPQGAMYKYIDEGHWSLFDACGPLRKVGMGNPHQHPTEHYEATEEKDRDVRRAE